MSGQKHSLFREEALQYRSDRLQGNVSLETPLSWQMITLLLIVALAGTVAFLAFGSYARIETVKGVVALDRGVATVLPSRPGVVQSVMVKEGARVRSGQVLLHVRSEEALIGGDTAPELVRRAIREQDSRLLTQAAMIRRAAAADQARLRERAGGAAQEIASLDAQAADQAQLIAAAQLDYDRTRAVAANGFISKRDLEARQATILSRRQQLAQLNQLRSAKQADLAEAERAIAQSAAAAEAEIANTDSSRAALLQQVAQSDLARGYAIVAPVDGVVTGVTARLGQAVATDRPLMLIVPAHARPSVELYVPTKAGAFLRRGQEVRLAVDAFPFQSFGTIDSRIRDISSAAVTKDGPDGPVPVYLVTSDLAQPWVKAFGRREPLLPGMTLTARIVTERRNLFEWLLEPVFAVGNR
ncbi:MAG TPA: HlyD family efflux transporter periplasmic adaptor subunit [Allosphingosinicella sp.]|jgi:membrane fusion protein